MSRSIPGPRTTALSQRKPRDAAAPLLVTSAQRTQAAHAHQAFADAIRAALDDAKAEDVVALDVGKKTSLADLMVIASGRSNVHVNAIAERVIKACKEGGLASPRVAGLPQCDWAVIDAGDVIVHIFRPETRAFYNLEKMWSGDRPAETAARGLGRAAL